MRGGSEASRCHPFYDDYLPLVVPAVWQAVLPGARRRPRDWGAWAPVESLWPLVMLLGSKKEALKENGEKIQQKGLNG